MSTVGTCDTCEKQRVLFAGQTIGGGHIWRCGECLGDDYIDCPSCEGRGTDCTRCDGRGRLDVLKPDEGK